MFGEKFIYVLLSIVTLTSLGVFLTKSINSESIIETPELSVTTLTPTITDSPSPTIIETKPTETPMPTTIIQPTDMVFPTSPPINKSIKGRDDDREKEDDD